MTLGLLVVYPPLPPSTSARSPARRLPFPLAEDGCRLYAQGRQALFQGVRGVGLNPGDEVLVPAYHHGSEVEALIRAGLRCRFYDATETLEPDAAELEALLGPRTRALHLTHFLGLPQDARRWRRWCDDRELLLIEDAAQAWLAEADGAPVGSWGDVSIYCLYKTFGLPDGAALSGPGGTVPGSVPRPGIREMARRNLAWLGGRFGGRLISGPDASEGEVPADRQFALGDPDSPPARASAMLLRRVIDPLAPDRRRAHYRLLLDALAERVPAPFDRLPAGASPFAFPIQSADKREELLALRRSGVVGLDFWSQPHPHLPAAAFPGAASRRGGLIALPVHQELRTEDMERIAAAATGRRRRTQPELRLAPLARTEVVPEEWNALAQAGANVFATWEWVATWWEHFGEGSRWLATACRTADGRLVGVLPLCATSHGPLRILRLLGDGPGDRLGPICAPADRTPVARAFARALREDRWRCDAFLGRNVSREEGWGALLGATVLRSEPDPVLRLRGRDWESVLGGWSRKTRKNAEYLQRRLERADAATYRVATTRQELEEGWDSLLALHAARFHGERTLFLEQQAFHRAFAQVAFDRGWLRLWRLEAAGLPVAAWHGFRFAGNESFYQSGRDPAWDRRSVGFVLLVHAIREALADGMAEFRFLGGEQAYKARLAGEIGHVDLVVRTCSPRGAGVLAIRNAVKRWPRPDEAELEDSGGQ